MFIIRKWIIFTVSSTQIHYKMMTRVTIQIPWSWMIGRWMSIRSCTLTTSWSTRAGYRVITSNPIDRVSRYISRTNSNSSTSLIIKKMAFQTKRVMVDLISMRWILAVEILKMYASTLEFLWTNRGSEWIIITVSIVDRQALPRPVVIIRQKLKDKVQTQAVSNQSWLNWEVGVLPRV